MTPLGSIMPAQHATLKEQIHSHLKDKGIFNSLKTIVSTALQQPGGESSSSTSAAALTAAQRASVLARIVADQTGAIPPPRLQNASDQRSLLHVHLLGGRAFSHADSEPAGEADIERGRIYVSLQLGGQRFRSKSVPFCAEPQLCDGVLLELPQPDEVAVKAAAAAATPAVATLETLRGLLRAGEPIHLLVVHQLEGREILVSSSLLEWRQVLHHGRQTLSLELPGVGAQSTLPIGALEVKLELLPLPQAESCMTEAEVMIALKKERDSQVDCERRFFAYARSWWSQYLELVPMSCASNPLQMYGYICMGSCMGTCKSWCR